ncbi:GlcNAc-transferase family protein [Rhodococcus sp. O3]|uniref:GlcNAc-transferase family protein n=1 Tax=Rhodococcus sp. O3 TaxID=3404919 RepID=UPI003B676379
MKPAPPGWPGGCRDPALYVQVPAYRDRELGPTLRDLYAQAAHPERLRVRVMWQRTEDEVLPDDVVALPGLEIDEIAASRSEGCNWARRRLQGAWKGEPYTLLIDSHHRFAAGWDDTAVGMLEGLRSSGIAKPILTGYLPAYSPDDDRCRAMRPLRIYPYLRDRGVLTRLRGAAMVGFPDLVAPAPADFASLHFLLTDGGYNEEVRFDPGVYFFGDEVLTSVRAFAAGYRLFHPHRVIGWHAYERDTRRTHWSDHGGYDERQERSLEALRRYLTGDGEVSPADVSAFESHVNLTLVTS